MPASRENKSAAREDSAVVLKVSDLAVSAGGRNLYEAVAFDLSPGERLAIAGPSGSGKTTLLRLLAGLISAERGELRLQGQTIAAVGYPQWRRRVVLLQQRPVMLDADVHTNLAFPFEFATAPGPWPRAQVSAWLAELGLDLAAIAAQQARDLSVGEQQRLALVRALSLQPAVLLADEPTSALDAPTAAAVEALLLRRCAEAELACVVVSHDQPWLSRFCSRRLDLRPAEGPQPALEDAHGQP